MFLIDADVVAYRIAYATTNENLKAAKQSLDDFVSTIIAQGADDCESYQLYLTGHGNYREKVATIQPYKGNRGNREKPKWFYDMRDRLEDEWGAEVIHGQEADDALAIAATANPNCIIATIDKDLLQVPGRHYNFVKEIYQEVSEVEGLRFLYKQMLTGDRTDNIRGVHGIGEKKAEKILEGLTTEAELHDAVLATYEGNLAEMTENAILLYMRRVPNEWWVPLPIRNQLYGGINPTEKPDYEKDIKECT
jgi:5'-3' exonuclease